MNRILGLAITLITLTALLLPAGAFALPKGLIWGMSPSEAQKNLGVPIKKIVTGKVEDLYYSDIDYGGIKFTFHLAFNEKSKLFYMDASDPKGLDCSNESSCRRDFEKILAQLSKDVPGIDTKYNESSSKDLKVMLDTRGKIEKTRFVYHLWINKKMVGHYAIILEQMKK